MANLKNITDVPVVESAEGLNLIVNDNGTAKQIAASAVGGRANWNQNNPTTPGYIENRPFWTEDPVEIELMNLTFTPVEIFNSICIYGTIGDVNLIIPGQEYAVILDGVEYACVASYDDQGGIVVGNVNMFAGGVSGEPFAIYPFIDGSDSGYEIYVREQREHSLVVKTCMREVHKIDRKYIDIDIPDWSQNDRHEGGYIANRPFYMHIENYTVLRECVIHVDADGNAFNIGSLDEDVFDRFGSNYDNGLDFDWMWVGGTDFKLTLDGEEYNDCVYEENEYYIFIENRFLDLCIIYEKSTGNVQFAGPDYAGSTHTIGISVDVYIPNFYPDAPDLNRLDGLATYLKSAYLDTRTAIGVGKNENDGSYELFVFDRSKLKWTPISVHLLSKRLDWYEGNPPITLSYFTFEAQDNGSYKINNVKTCDTAMVDNAPYGGYTNGALQVYGTKQMWEPFNFNPHVVYFSAFSPDDSRWHTEISEFRIYRLDGDWVEVAYNSTGPL